MEFHVGIQIIAHGGREFSRMFRGKGEVLGQAAAVARAAGDGGLDGTTNVLMGGLLW